MGFGAWVIGCTSEESETASVWAMLSKVQMVATNSSAICGKAGV